MKVRLIRLFVALAVAAGMIWFVIPFHWNVHNIGNLSGLAVCVGVLLVCAFYPKIKERCGVSKSLRVFCRVIAVLFCLGILWSTVLTGLMISGMTAVPPENATVVVLGSKVSGHTPSADLMERIKTAENWLTAHPDAKCVVSGGQGAGELESEASVMKKYLVNMGINASRIHMEDDSTTTRENLKNSLALINRQGFGKKLAIVTDEYHQYRAGQIAESLGAEPYAVCARTPWYIFSACYARELLALTNYLIFS